MRDDYLQQERENMVLEASFNADTPICVTYLYTEKNLSPALRKISEHNLKLITRLKAEIAKLREWDIREY